MTQDPFRPAQEPLLVDETELDLVAEADDMTAYDGMETDQDNLEEFRPKKSRRNIGILLGAVSLAVLTGGYFAYQSMMGNETGSFNAVPESIAPPVVTPPQPAVVDPNAQITPIDDTTAVPVVDPVTGQIITPPATDPALAAASGDVTPLQPAVNADGAPVPSVVPPPPNDTVGNAPPVTATPVPETVTPANTAVGAAAPAVTEVAVAPVVPTAAAANAPVAPVIPQPPVDQLKPIDQNAVLDRAANLPLPDAKQKKAIETMAEVNQILGGNTAGSGAQATMAQQVEVTPRAAQVIVVKKNYSATSPQALVAAGDRVLDDKQYGAAIAIYNRQLAQNPSDPIALSGKALAQQRSGESAAAMDTYQRLLDLNPRDLEALTNYLGLLQKQNPQEALSRLNTLSAQYPDNAAVAGQLGMINAKLLDTPNALRYFQKAAALDPANPTYSYNQAILYDRLGSSQKAYQSYTRALEVARSSGSDVPVETIRERLRALKY